MIPNQSQIIELQTYLRRHLRYRETYAEFYDHILTALENQPVNINFSNAIKNIIDEDFGGMAGMRTIEIRYRKSTFREMQKKYFDGLLSCLSFPLILFLLAHAVIVYYLVQQHWYNLFTFLILAVAIRLVPVLLKWIRYIRSGYVFGDIKRSVKDSFFKWVDYIPGIILLTVMCGADLFGSTPPALIKNPIFNAIFLIISGWHAIAFYQVYIYDVRTSLRIN